MFHRKWMILREKYLPHTKAISGDSEKHEVKYIELVWPILF